jgi:hypothetical protein
MSELAKLDERVSRLEREMGDVRKLAASAKALRKTQVEQGKRMDAGFAAVDMRFAGVDRRFATLEGEMREGFSTMGVGMAEINALLRIAIGQPDDES